MPNSSERYPKLSFLSKHLHAKIFIWIFNYLVIVTQDLGTLFSFHIIFLNCLTLKSQHNHLPLSKQPPVGYNWVANDAS